MVTYAEVKQILADMPQDLNSVAFLSDIYQKLSAYTGDELSADVKRALQRIKQFIDNETNQTIQPGSLTPEQAVVLNDYLSIYPKESLTASQKNLKNEISPLLDKFDKENDLETIHTGTNINYNLNACMMQVALNLLFRGLAGLK